MERFLSFLVISQIFLLSCSSREQKFVEFFVSFNNDANVQMEHIQFPLMCYIYEDYGLREESIEKSEWTTLSYPLDSVIAKYRQLSKNAVVLSIKYPDTGMFYELVFRCLDGNWVLTDYVDMSN